MATTSTENRPYKYGAQDRREFIVADSEQEMRFENDANGNALYIGYAKADSAEGDAVWKISFQAYDANSAITSRKWPQNASGIATTNYEFSWTARAGYTFS